MEVNRIILGDCLETISFLDDGVADLIILP